MKKLLLILFIITITLLLITNISGCKKPPEPTDWRKVSWQWSSPYEAPKGDKIVFVSNRDGNCEIYLVNIDGTGLKRITDSPGNEYQPDLSPDGTKVAFEYPYSIHGEEDKEIYMINTDGSGRKNLTDNEDYDWDPCFSPDGSKIAFSSTRDGNPEIYIMNVDGSDQIRLTDSPGGDWGPCFSPDGTKIAFVSRRDEIIDKREISDKDVDEIYNPEIYIMNVDGSNQTRLTDNNDNKCTFGAPIDEEPCFSPDGKNIAFTSYCEGDGIFIMNIDSFEKEEFIGFSSNDTSYCLSPDWSKFVISNSYGPGEEEGREIFIYDVGDKHREHGINLSNNPASDFLPSF